MSQLSLINRIYNFKIFNFSLFASLLFFSISYFLHSAPVTIVFEGTGTLTRSAVKSTFAAKNLPLDAPIHIVVRQHTAIGANAFNPDHVGDSEPLMRNIESLTVEDGCLAIDSQAFAYCTGLTTVNIRSNLLTISFMAFFGCSSLINVTLPETVQTISNRVFSACEKLEISKLPGNLTTLGEIAFSSCKKITSISFPEGLAIIGKQCFAQCVSLAKITLPSSIKIIQKEAFSGCINLQQVDCYAAEPPLLGIAAFNLSSSSKLLYVVSTSLESYKKDMDLDCSSQSNYEIGCYG